MDQQETILILDFGSQYTQLIARRIREISIFSSIVSFKISIDDIRIIRPKGIILSGSPASVYNKNAPKCDPQVFELGIPVLGICYGLQLMVETLGGKVASDRKREFGDADVEVNEASKLFRGLDKIQKVWMSHGDKVLTLPPDFSTIGKTSSTDFAAIEDDNRRLYGLQFHPEVAHTPNGIEILAKFCVNICECHQNWEIKRLITQSIRDIRETVGNKKVVLGLSGGVDSSVAAALINQAIGKKLICVFVDNGLLRQNEKEKVSELFGNQFSLNFHAVDAGDRFLSELKGVTDPEKKRKVIGHQFIEVFDDVASKFEDVYFLGQGTTYPDVIESISIDGSPSSLIKSHHNVGALPEYMKLDLLEPLRNLFKDEVREVGEQLGLPKELVMRQPYPGPGLAVRIIGEVTKERLHTIRQADTIVIEEMKKAGEYYNVWQSFAVLLPVQSVGVMGDERTYENVVALRIVQSVDGMTANWAQIPYEILGTISNRIINEVRGINRVCYDISNKPPSTIEWE